MDLILAYHNIHNVIMPPKAHVQSLSSLLEDTDNLSGIHAWHLNLKLLFLPKAGKRAGVSWGAWIFPSAWLLHQSSPHLAGLNDLLTVERFSGGEQVHTFAKFALTTLKKCLAGLGTRLSPNIARTWKFPSACARTWKLPTCEPGSLSWSNLPVLND